MTMPRLVFVDDEPRVLEGLENLLFDRLDAWDLEFVVGGPAALARLDAPAPMDVLVTDMRMPGVDGLDVLRHTVAVRPHVMRVVLSGHAEKEKALQAITIAHQYLSKPCEEDALISTLERALRIQAAIRDGDLRRTVGVLSDTAPGDATLTEVRTRAQVASTSIVELAELVSRDVGLTTKLLQVANSAIFGRGTITTVGAAVQRLGMDALAALAVAFAAYGRIPVADPALAAEANRHALVVGRIARALCADPAQADQAFLAGVLHGLGTMALAAHVPQRLRRAWAQIGPGRTRVDVEDAEFQIDHARLGAEILELWHMREFADLLRHHHAPSRVEPTPRGLSVLGALHLADLAASGSADELDRDYLAALGPRGAEAWARAQHLAHGLSAGAP